MKKSITINESQLHNLIFESVRQVLNELSYDDWKLMTPEEDANLSSYDVEITIRVLVDNEELPLWNKFKKTEVNQLDDGLTEFVTAYRDEVWISNWCRDRDSFEDELREQCKESASSFVNQHGSSTEYELVDYEVI